MRMILTALSALALTGCAALAALPAALPAPATVSDRSVVDEKAALTAEIAYTTASLFGDNLSRVGMIDREAFKQADAKAFTALQAVRAAYAAGNAQTVATALEDLNTAIAAIRDLAKGA